MDRRVFMGGMAALLPAMTTAQATPDTGKGRSLDVLHQVIGDVIGEGRVSSLVSLLEGEDHFQDDMVIKFASLVDQLQSLMGTTEIPFSVYFSAGDYGKAIAAVGLGLPARYFLFLYITTNAATGGITSIHYGYHPVDF